MPSAPKRPLARKAPPAPRGRRGRLSLPKKLVFAAVATVAFFALLELALWAVGVHAAIERGDPSRGFSGLVDVFRREGDVYRTVRSSVPQTFNDQSFEAAKPARGFRIFCLGGSSSYGFPWDGKRAFTAMVGELLQAAHPDRTIEAVNASGISYGIHRLRLLTRELIHYSPDLIIVYSGHNEFIEPTFFRELKRSDPELLRLENAFAHSRVYSIMRDLLRPSPSAGGTAEDRFDLSVARNQSVVYDAQAKERIVREYRAALEEILALARGCGAKVMLATVPCNVRDWSPEQSTIQAPMTVEDRRDWARALAAGRRHLEEGRAADAAGELQRARDLAPSHAETQFLLGKAFDALGRWDEARDCYRLACDDDASPIRRISAINEAVAGVARKEGALLVDVQHRFEELSEHGLVGLNLIEDYVHPTLEGHRIIARMMWEAIESAGWLGTPAARGDALFEEVMSRRQPAKPNEVWLFNQAYMLAHQGHHKEAIRKYRQALEISPTYPAALLNLARLLAHGGETEEARTFVESLLRAKPEHVEGRVLLGSIHALAGRDGDAIVAFRKALDKDPDHVAANVYLGGVLHRTGDFEGAKAAFAHALELEPGNEEAAIGMASALESLNDRAAAVARLRQVLERNPSSATGHHHLGKLLCRTGKTPEGIRLLEVACTLDPTRAEIPFDLAVVRLAAGAPDEALEPARRGLAIDGASAQGHELLGRIQAARGESKEAIMSFREAVRIEPRRTTARYLLAASLEQSGEAAEAIEQYREIVRQRPDWDAPWNNLAWLLATHPRAELRDADEALRCATRAVELTGRKSPDTLDTLGAAYAAAGRFAEAAAAAREALGLVDEARKDDLARAIRNRIGLYERKRAYVESPR